MRTAVPMHWIGPYRHSDEELAAIQPAIDRPFAVYRQTLPDLNTSFLKRNTPNRVSCARFMSHPGTTICNDPNKSAVAITFQDLSKYNHRVTGLVPIPNGLTYDQLVTNGSILLMTFRPAQS
jgi:hypothetical protein